MTKHTAPRSNRSPHDSRWTSRSAWGCGVMLAAVLLGCNERGTNQPVKTQPYDLPGPAVPSTVVPESASQPEPQTRPASEPTASRPAKPESTYSSEPPYPVALYVEAPDDKQPGWLKIETFTEDNRMATATGRFPEQNRIYVDTTNVRRIRIHIGHLPLAPKERVILQIDKQGMVISRQNPYTTLERKPTGEWVVEKAK